MIIELLKSLILGIIEGVTDWLPISRRGNLLLGMNYQAEGPANSTVCSSMSYSSGPYLLSLFSFGIS
jgi:undecaprenyl pyrophosphate phosphatase UppP